MYLLDSNIDWAYGPFRGEILSSCRNKSPSCEDGEGSAYPRKRGNMGFSSRKNPLQKGTTDLPTTPGRTRHASRAVAVSSCGGRCAKVHTTKRGRRSSMHFLNSSERTPTRGKESFNVVGEEVAWEEGERWVGLTRHKTTEDYEKRIVLGGYIPTPSN